MMTHGIVTDSDSPSVRIRTIDGHHEPSMTPKIDPETGLQLEIGPLQLLGHHGSTWVVMCWDAKFGKPVSDPFPSIFEAHQAMIESYRQWYAAQPEPVVYFVGTNLHPTKGRVKVGYTRRLKERLATLQTGSPEPLIVFATAPGSRALEQQYHNRWRNYRVQGEWFLPGKPIQREIARLQEIAA